MPDKTNEPFHYSYTYTRKDYPNWADREISAPLPPVMLPEVSEDEAKPSHPVWLGSAPELHFTAEVQLPKGYVPELPKDVNLKEDFAEYHATYTLKEGVLITERKFVPKLQEIPIGETDAYKKFRKAVDGDHELYITLQSNTRPHHGDTKAKSGNSLTAKTLKRPGLTTRHAKPSRKKITWLS